MNGPYRVLYADPPWRFHAWSGRGEDRGAAQHYACLDIEGLCALPIGAMAAADAALFLWVVQPMLPEALRLVTAWGFTFKTVAFYWIKIRGTAERAGQDKLFYAGEDVRLGLGYHTRSGAEQCWLATRGRGYQRLSRGEPQVVFAPVREHSRKPVEIARSIEALTGEVPRLELFARETRPGWAAWGDAKVRREGRLMPEWSPERVAEAVSMIEGGASYASVGAHFGCSRNAIIGLVRRVRERTDAQPVRVPKPAQPTQPKPMEAKPEPAAGAALVPRAPERRRPFTVPVKPKPLEVCRQTAFVAPAATRPLLDLAAIGECRWPYDDHDGVARLACGAATGSDDPRTVYCPAHRGLAYQPRKAA